MSPSVKEAMLTSIPVYMAGSLCTIGGREFPTAGGCLLYCKGGNSIPGLPPLDDSSTPHPVVTTTNVSRHYQGSTGQTGSQLKTTWYINIYNCISFYEHLLNFTDKEMEAQRLRKKRVYLLWSS